MYFRPISFWDLVCLNRNLCPQEVIFLPLLSVPITHIISLQIGQGLRLNIECFSLLMVQFIPFEPYYKQAEGPGQGFVISTVVKEFFGILLKIFPKLISTNDWGIIGGV
jgi:hypothetical protein